jgi:peptidoglycan/xylan/chitin deacetylase (PgdA/CDA1 family)
MGDCAEVRCHPPLTHTSFCREPAACDSAIRHPPHPPGGARLPVAGWGEGGCHFQHRLRGLVGRQSPRHRPHGQPGFFDTNAASWGHYGAVRGIQRLLRIADKHRIRTSVMINGVLAEKHPETVAAMHRAGHDLVAHSYGMDVIPVYLDEAAERANIARTTTLIENAAGIRPRGWISPRATNSPRSLRLLAEAGYLWHGDCNDDDLPALVNVGDTSLVAIPLTMDINDLPHCIRYGNDPAELLAQFRDVLDRAPKADPQPVMIDVTAHTHVFGRPASAWVYNAMMALALERLARREIWIATRAEVAAHARASAKHFA